MLVRLMILFILVPIIELALLLKLGTIIGIVPTILIIILTGIVGIWLARQQGFRVLTDFQQSVSLGYMPGDSMLEGILILLGAAVLLTPGLITDTFGFMMLIPVTRKITRELIKNRLRYYFEHGEFRIIIK